MFAHGVKRRGHRAERMAHSVRSHARRQGGVAFFAMRSALRALRLQQRGDLIGFGKKPENAARVDENNAFPKTARMAIEFPGHAEKRLAGVDRVEQDALGSGERGDALAMVAGNMIIEEAKIGGITPDVFIFKGRWVLWPPYILRPTTRLAYCTGIRRCPRSMKTMP